ncbi:hypothetical protein PBRA_006402 [Plasmodiophora brassicae]|nr:hypothetical protein PBRA_006402 [Plasmodiophora brassicae]
MGPAHDDGSASVCRLLAASACADSPSAQVVMSDAGSNIVGDDDDQSFVLSESTAPSSAQHEPEPHDGHPPPSDDHDTDSADVATTSVVIEKRSTDIASSRDPGSDIENDDVDSNARSRYPSDDQMKAPLTEIRRLLARYELQKHVLTEEYINEKLPALRKQVTETRDAQRRARSRLTASLKNLNAMIDDTSRFLRSDDAAAVREPPVQVQRQVDDQVDALTEGNSWKAVQYKLDGQFRW